MKSINRYAMNLFGLIILIMSTNFSLMAQLPLEINKQTPYYIGINNAESSKVYEIQEGLLNLQYEDRIGISKEIRLQIYNWKLEKAGTFVLEKTFGLNNYTIDLIKKLSVLEGEKNYHCTLEDESGNQYKWSFKNIVPLKSEDLQINILVKPVRVACSDHFGNLTELYGQISNGKAPYSVRWYVLNQQKTDFLYQPKEEQIDSPGKTAVIEVDKTPSYYVIMDVTDACGTNLRQMVLLDCEKNKKTIHTIFVEQNNIPNSLPVVGN